MNTHEKYNSAPISGSAFFLLAPSLKPGFTHRVFGGRAFLFKGDNNAVD